MNDLMTTDQFLTSRYSAIDALDGELNQPCSAEQATKAVRVILGSFPNRGTIDPDVYVRQIVILLTGYPSFVARKIAHPRDGIVSRNNFLPTLAEVKAFADALTIPKRSRRDAMYRQIEQIRKPEEPEVDKPSLDDLKARYGNDWGIHAEAQEAVDAATARRDAICEANERIRRRELVAAGIDPDSTELSLGLIKALGLMPRGRSAA